MFPPKIDFKIKSKISTNNKVYLLKMCLNFGSSNQDHIKSLTLLLVTGFFKKFFENFISVLWMVSSES